MTLMLLLIVLALRRQVHPAPWLMLALLLFEILVINGMIALNGAASNPFNAILLVPLVLGFMLLPYSHAMVVLFVSITAQLTQLGLLSEHSHHLGQMLGHYYAMVGSFVLTAALMAALVAYFRVLLSRSEQAINTLREKQLRDEQLLAIGTAAAQLSHDVATPVQSIRLLLEEVLEQQPQSESLQCLEQQFQRIEQHLINWREVADDVREKRLHAYSIDELWLSLQYLMTVARPESNIDWKLLTERSTAVIHADRTLLPALTSIIINACEAATFAPNKGVSITASKSENRWVLNIINEGESLSKETIAVLGSRVTPSVKGHGIGAVLSNATLEKFSGEVNWQQQGKQIITSVYLPLIEPN
jgi:two-component system, sensor histidine kinase RegB